ncbi:MAG: adenylate/guanylate cyclase domain-containing protein [Myxococcales bacterium]|nr:adenylate/guanylate cyclase domain-containing protein [Myxococcales bacterium]
MTNPTSTGIAAVASVYDWLVDGAPGAANAKEVVAQLAPQLLACGIPLDRVEAFVRTLHPHIVGRGFHWHPDTGVEVRENSYAYLQSPAFLLSPVSAVFQSGNEVRLHLGENAPPEQYAALQRLADQGYTDYFAGPLRFLSGQVHAITFATKRAGGFTVAHIAGLRQILRPLSRLAEILALSRTAVNLLNTYVGNDAGDRIMQGAIRRGDTESTRAVIWFSDLRGFTAMSSELPPTAIIATLNDLFDCQVPAIDACGGQVLKFIGDGLLAIFPLRTKSEPQVCDAALDAAGRAFAALVDLNERRQSAGQKPIAFGLALHIGEIAYGNIGGLGRLDFTCIGPAVNLAARLESLTSSLGRTMVVSAEFAATTSKPAQSLGSFALKGVPAPVEVFAPVQE